MLEDYYQIFSLPSERNYQHAEDGFGFINSQQETTASLSFPEPINYVALLQFTKDEPRAQHYHKLKSEYIAVLSGILQFELTLVSDSSQKTTVNVSKGSIIYIKPYCYHVVRPISNTATALEASPQKLILSDTYKL